MISEKLNRPDRSTDEISLNDLVVRLKEWYRFLLSKWLLIIIFGLIGGVVGFTYAYLKKPYYTATTSFVLEDAGAGSNSLGGLGGLASMVGVDIGGSGGGIFQGDNILELYKSRAMIEKTLLTEIQFDNKKQLLVELYISFNNLRSGWKNNHKLQNIHFKVSSPSTRLQDSLLGVIVSDINKNYLTVSKPDKKLSIIKADVKASNEFFAKAFNDNIVKNVNDFYVQTKTKKSLENVSILQHKTDSVRAVMNGAISSAAVIIDGTPNLNPTRQAQRSIPVQRSQFNAEMNRAILSELVKNLELSKISLNKETPLIQVVDKPIFPLNKVQLGKVKAILIGGIFAAFLIIVIFTLKLIFKHILNEN